MKKCIFLFLGVLLSACIPQPAPQPTPTNSIPFIIIAADNPFAPRPDDLSMQIGGVVLTSLDLTEQVESNPVRVKLNILGSLPRACDELRIEVEDPDEQYRIFVNIYSLVNSKIECENVFQQFETSLLLGVYSPGRYTVWANNELVGDFVSY